MSLTVPGLLLPLIAQTLGGLSRSLKKGAAFAEARKFDPTVLIHARLAPDQFPLIRQAQLTTDFARKGVARLTGRAVENWPDIESTFDELTARIRRTRDWIDAVPVAEFDGYDSRTIELQVGSRAISFSGLDYLTHFLIPNLMFHAATAYAILRHNGVEIGKMDFVNAPPSPA